MNTHQKSYYFEQFKLLYRGGFGVSIVVLFLVIYKKLPDISIPFIGILHIIGLFCLAIKVKNTNSLLVSAGNRIQTAGYLYTLIGFATALIFMGESSFQIEKLSIPLATKLCTSFFGWLLGGELIAEGESDNISLQQATQELISDIQNHADELKKINMSTIEYMQKISTSSLEKMKQSHEITLNSIEQKYSVNLNEIEKLLKEHKDRMNDLYIEATRNSKSLNDAVNNMTIDVTQNSKSLNDAVNSMTIDVTQNSKSLSTALDESSVRISESATKIKKSVDEYDIILKDAREYSTKAILVLSELSTSLDNFKDEIKVTISSANSLTTKVDTWASATQSMTTNMNLVITNLQDLIQHIMSISGNNEL
jgi:hypothetical protein